MNSKAQILKTVCDALLAGDTQAAKVGKKEPADADPDTLRRQNPFHRLLGGGCVPGGGSGGFAPGGAGGGGAPLFGSGGGG